MHVELETPPWRSNELQCHARCSLHAARCTVHSRAGHKTRKKPMNGEQQGQGGGENERRSDRTGQETSDSTENSYLF